MRLAGGLLGLLLLIAGCQEGPLWRDPPAEAMFGPQRMVIHPIFTGLRDWTADGRIDGIDAQIEFQDGLGDPTKAAGTFVFEVYEYSPGQPDPRGQRVVNPWVGSIVTLEEQRLRWNRTTGTYGFQLEAPRLRPDQHYVLTAVFELAGGGRFFDRVILDPLD